MEARGFGLMDGACLNYQIKWKILSFPSIYSTKCRIGICIFSIQNATQITLDYLCKKHRFDQCLFLYENNNLLTKQW